METVVLSFRKLLAEESEKLTYLLESEQINHQATEL